MIDRLVKLDVTDFRTFGGPHEITLDADAILIHGKNGTGKSSLLYAIEFALTGEVADLKGFVKDYPRCLRFVDATGPGNVRLVFQENGAERQVIRDIAPTPTESSIPKFLKTSEARFFKERCFLSQVRLSRLLEVYQTIPEGSSETPLVAFVRRLLSLDPLEDLMTSLRDFTDVRRTRKAFPRFAELEDLQARLPEKQRKLRDDIKAAESKQQLRIAEARVALDEIGRPLNADQWNLESVQSLREALASELAAGSAESQLLRFERAHNEIRTLRLIVTNEQSSEDVVLALQQAVDSDVTRLEELASVHGAALRAIVERASLLQLSRASLSADASISELWTAARISVEPLRSSLTTELASLDSLNKSREEAETRRKHLATQMEDLSRRIARVTTNLPRSVDLLAELANYVDGNVCPLCQRDFGELRRESLKEFMTRRIEQLGIQVDAIQTLTVERERASSEIEEITRTIATIDERIQRGEARDVLSARLKEAEALDSDLESRQQQIAEWHAIWARLQSNRAKWSLSQSRLQQIGDAKAKVAELASFLSVAHSGALPLVATIEALESKCALKREEELRRLSSWRRAIGILDEILRGINSRTAFDREWLALDQRLRTCQGMREKVDSFINFGKTVNKAAHEAKRKLLERVFDQRLNSLWEDLFDRLVRNERFRPRLGDPAGWRDQIRTAIQAVADGCETFENIGAIQSLGNLNTAALSLFLSLNLVEKVQNRVLILDDPVQSMDDVHVTQLGLLLRELVLQANRQIVVAVHDRTLFDFLAFELAPAAPGRKLVLIDLAWQQQTASTVCKITTKEWSADKVSIAAEPNQRVAS